jgi:AcrR family transcriptional regulator
MSPRPKTVDDEAILAATGRVIGRVGPHKLTLALIAEEVGLAPSTLVQRFGSKRGLLLSLGRSGESSGESFVAKLRARHRSPLKVLREFLLCFAKMARTPDELANHLAAFHLDLVDPELRDLTREIAVDNESTVAELIQDALEAGELRGCNAKALAPVLLTVTQGSLLTWAVFRKGSARGWAARHIDTALEPYLA